MSYRNPKVVIDRSAMVWAQGLERIGNIWEDYAKTRAAADKKKRENEDLVDRSINSAQLNERKRLKNVSIEKYPDDPQLADQYYSLMEKSANEAIAAQVRIKMDTSLDRNQRKELSSVVTKYQDLEQDSMQDIAYLGTDADTFNGETLNAETITRDYAIQGEGKDEVLNLWTGLKLGSNNLPEGVDGKLTDTYRALNPNTNKYETYTNIQYKLDPSSSYVKDLIAKGYIEEGATDLTHKMNLTQRRLNGESFAKKIAPQDDRVKTLEDSGYVKKGQATGKGVDETPIIRTEIQGDNRLNIQENHFDFGRFLGDPEYSALIDSQIDGLSTLSQAEQKDYIDNRFSWGKLIKTEDYFNATPEARKAFLQWQLASQDAASMGLKQRSATEEDVKEYERRGYNPIEVGQPIFFSENVRVERIRPTSTSTGRGSTSKKEKEKLVRERASNIVDSLLKNPATTIREKLGPSQEFSQKGKVVSITDSDGNVQSFDMNRKEDIINLARTLDQIQYGKDSTTDLVSTEIGDYTNLRQARRTGDTSSLTDSQRMRFFMNQLNK